MAGVFPDDATDDPVFSVPNNVARALCCSHTALISNLLYVDRQHTSTAERLSTGADGPSNEPHDPGDVACASDPPPSATLLGHASLSYAGCRPTLSISWNAELDLPLETVAGHGSCSGLCAMVQPVPLRGVLTPTIAGQLLQRACLLYAIGT